MGVPQEYTTSPLGEKLQTTMDPVGLCFVVGPEEGPRWSRYVLFYIHPSVQDESVSQDCWEYLSPGSLDA